MQGQCVESFVPVAGKNDRRAGLLRKLVGKVFDLFFQGHTLKGLEIQSVFLWRGLFKQCAFADSSAPVYNSKFGTFRNNCLFNDL